MSVRTSRRARTSISALALLTGLTAIASPSIAQDRSEGAAETASSVGEIIVTARRREERIQDVPLAVTALSPTVLQDQGIQTLGDLTRVSPGMRINESPASRSSINIVSRGQSVSNFDSSLDNSVGVYLDGIYVSRLFGVNTGLVDIEQVELLRGPQGTLFGRNTPGGAILIKTADPRADAVSGMARGTIGNLGERAAEGVLNLPLVTDKVAVRFAVKKEDFDGVGRNLTVPFQRLGALDNLNLRGKLLIEPNEGLRAVFGADYFRSRSTPLPMRLVYADPAAPSTAVFRQRVAAGNSFGDPNSLDFYLNNDFGYDGYLDHQVVGSLFPNLTGTPSSKGEATQVYGDISKEIGQATLKALVGYRHLNATTLSDLDGTPYSLLSQTTFYDFKQYSAELQLSGEAISDRLNYTVGLFYFKEDGEDTGQQEQHTDSYAAYAQASYQLSDNLSATAGVRYFIDEKRPVAVSKQVAANGTNICRTPAVLQNDPDNPCFIHFYRKDKKLPFSFSLEYKATPDVLVYGKIARGYRSGGFNAKAAVAAAAVNTTPLATAEALFAPFAPEELIEYEVGLKTQFLDHRGVFNIAAYYDDAKVLQRTSSEVPVGGGQPIGRVNSSSKGRVKGVEAEMSFQLTPAFQVGGTLAYTDAKYTRYFDTFIVGGAPVTSDRTAEPFPFTAKYTYTLFAAYERDLGFSDFRGNLNWYHTSSVPYLVAAIIPGTEQLLRQKAYGLLGARAALTFDNNVEFAVFGSNLLDKEYDINIINAASLVARIRGLPRTYGAELTFRF